MSAHHDGKNRPSQSRRAAKELPPGLPSTIFHEYWWLQAATGGRFREVTVKSDNQVIGRFPFVLNRTLDGRVLNGMPELTYFLGPLIVEGAGAPCNRVVKRIQILRELLDQMPPSTGFYQKMHAGVSEMLAFQERAYDISVQFTHDIAPAEEPALWSNLRDKTRNVIRRAGEQLKVDEIADPAEFMAAYDANLAARGTSNSYHRGRILDLCAQTLHRGRGRILGAREPNGRLTAAIYYVWDDDRAYYLMTTRTVDAANGSVSLLLWKALVDSAGRGLIFDLAGVAAAGDVLFFSGFGGSVSPRYIASRYSMRHRATDYMLTRFRRKPANSFT